MRNEPLPENLQSIVDTLANFHERRMYDWLDRQEELRRPKNPRLSLARTAPGTFTRQTQRRGSRMSRRNSPPK